MAVSQFPVFNAQFFLNDGTLAAGYSLYTYISGTTTPQATFSDSAGLVSNTNPIVLDAFGRCTLFGTIGVAYTFALKDASGTVVKTWDGNSPVPAALTGTYVPLAGGVTMLGQFNLSGNATSSLQPVPKQQLDSAITTALASVTSLTDAATAAAAAATAAANAITPPEFTLETASSTSRSRTVSLSAGTWDVVLTTLSQIDDSTLGTGSVTVTQSATVGTTTVNTSATMHRTGGAGYGRNNVGAGKGLGSLVVSTAGSYTMAIAAASGGSATVIGATLRLIKVS